MTTVRSISGIPDETWETAKKEYPNVSRKIKQLLEKDLQIKDQDNTQKLDYLKNSDLTTGQKKAAKSFIQNGSTKLNAAQVGEKLRKFFNEKDYRQECKNAMIQSDKIPFEKDGAGLSSIETKCECGASYQLNALRKAGFECSNCGRRLYDI